MDTRGQVILAPTADSLLLRFNTRVGLEHDTTGQRWVEARGLALERAAAVARRGRSA